MEEATKEKRVCASFLERIVSERPICPDMDMDCKDVDDPLACYLGHPERLGFDTETFEFFYYALPLADGHCPFIPTC